MAAPPLFPRIVTFISDPDDFEPVAFDLAHPIQRISEKGLQNLPFIRSLVADPGNSVTPGRMITFFLRDILLTLHGHPAIIPTFFLER
jgi:hypothetical protein